MLCNNIKGSAVNNFEIYYYRAKQQIVDWDKIIIVLNAYRSQLYVQIFNNDNLSEPPELLTYAEAIVLFKSQNPSGKIICAGSGLPFIYQDIKNLSGITVLPRFPIVKAWYICRYIDASFEARDMLPIEPLYIRSPGVSAPKTR